MSKEKAGVHKSDIHKHAVSASKIGTGVLRIDGFASTEFTGAFPPLHPETVLTSIKITTTTSGRIFGFGRGTYHVNCQMVSVVQAGMFVDGIPLVASGSRLPSDGSDAELNLFGATAASVGAGAHTLTVQADCPNGDVLSTGASLDVALGAIVIRN
jgi:hypothetical protein